MQTAELVALPLKERLMAMEVLWESLCREPSQAMLVPDWHQDELAQRVVALHDGTATVTPWEEAKDRIRGLAKALTQPK